MNYLTQQHGVAALASTDDPAPVAAETLARFKAMFGCDEVRVTSPCSQLFLILGRWRNTKDDERGQWLRNGEPVDFDYLAEEVVASGDTEEELIASAERYKALLDGGWREFFRQEGLPLTPEIEEAIALRENADRGRRRSRRREES